MESSGRCTNILVSGCGFSRLSPKNVCVLGTKGLNDADKQKSSSSNNNVTLLENSESEPGVSSATSNNTTFFFSE